MFFAAYAFNADIGNWNTAKVTVMTELFAYAKAFNQNIGSWNTAAVTGMSGMFIVAYKFTRTSAAGTRPR